MRFRRYLGLIIGVVFAVTLAASVAASTIGWNSVYDKPLGWNSPIFVHSPNGNITYKINHCYREYMNLGTHGVSFDLMHHWFALPSTGTRTVLYPCADYPGGTSTVYYYTWTNRASADYSIEYNGPGEFCLGAECYPANADWHYYIVYN